MELRNLLTDVELQVRKAREDFDVAAHGACLEHLVYLRELLNEQPELEAGGACESHESSDGS